MLVPCGHRVIVKADPVEITSTGGIIVIASETQKKMERSGSQVGTVVAVGPTAFKAFDRMAVRQTDGSDKVIGGEPWCKVGDRVYYSRYGGIFAADTEDNGEEYVILNDEDIVSIIKPGSMKI